MNTGRTAANRRALSRLMGIAVVAIVFGALATSASADPEPHFDLAEYEGQVVILDFWASWCVPCRRSFPWLNQMHKQYAEQGLVIIGVNLDNDVAEARKFLDKYPPDFRIHYDNEKQLARTFDVVAMPSSYVIGRDGELYKQHLGFKVKKQNEYEAAILSALRNTGDSE